MPIKPSHILLRPLYKTTHSNLDSVPETEKRNNFFLKSSVSAKRRKEAQLTYWQLYKGAPGKANYIESNDSIHTILLDDEPHAIITKLRDDFNYEFSNLFKPYRQLAFKNAKEIIASIRFGIMKKYPFLKEKDFEVRSYNIAESGPHVSPTGNRIHILIINHKHAQAVALVYEDDLGSTIFRRF